MSWDLKQAEKKYFTGVAFQWTSLICLLVSILFGKLYLSIPLGILLVLSVAYKFMWLFRFDKLKDNEKAKEIQN